MSLYRLIGGKEIKPVELAGRTLFDKTDLDELIRKAKTRRPVKKRGGKRTTPEQKKAISRS